MDKFVIQFGGGIGAQVWSMATALFLKRKYGDGVEIKSDLSWFREFGKDIDGIYDRNWDFPKAFPGLEFEEATQDEVLETKQARIYEGDDVHDVVPPAYIRYCKNDKLFNDECFDILSQRFCPELDDRSKQVLARIQTGNSCGIHVRRGDLAVFSIGRGDPAPVDYFIDSILMVHGIAPDAKFYFFSDEMEYVAKEIGPKIPKGIAYELVDGNGSGRGYCDLYLLSRCNYLVASTGSFGVLAAMLAPSLRKLFTPRYDAKILLGMADVVYFNYDRDFLNGKGPDMPVVRPVRAEYVFGQIKRKTGVYKPLYKLFKTLGKILTRP